MDPVIEFVHGPIEVPPLALATQETGSVLEFSGLVRRTEGERQLEGLFYEAHESMARRRLLFHAAELQELHPAQGVEFIHRLGWVPTGEASLYIRVLSRHRSEGLLFLSSLVLRLKQDVPIWKLPAPP